MSGADLTKLLIDWGDGDRSALDRLMPLVYDQLRHMAARYMSQENPGTLCKAPRWFTRRTSS